MLGSLLFVLATSQAQNKQDAIIGKWINEDKDLIVDVYKESNDFKAKVVWFHFDRDTLTPIDQWLDVKNPDKTLRKRKLLGMEVLSGLVYDPEENKWVKGKIYDSTSGRTWDANVWLSDPQTLEVRGYYIFKFIGRTMKFTKVS